MIVNDTYFKKVPQWQTGMLKQFIREHIYTSHYFKGRDYRYLHSGSGRQCILLLHGALFNAYMWFYTIKELESRFRVIVPELPQIGIGAVEAAGYIRSILEREGIKKAIIMGYSYGGGLAQFFAEYSPQYVEKLILSHTGLLRREGMEQQFAKMVRLLKYLPEGTVHLIKAIRTKSGKQSPWYQFRRAYFNQMFENITKKVFIDHFKKNGEFARETAYIPVGKASWKGETFILTTRSDRDTFPAFERLKELYPQNHHYIFEKPGGHHMIFLYPEAYTRILLQCLTDQEKISLNR